MINATAILLCTQEEDEAHDERKTGKKDASNRRQLGKYELEVIFGLLGVCVWQWWNYLFACKSIWMCHFRWKCQISREIITLSTRLSCYQISCTLARTIIIETNLFYFRIAITMRNVDCLCDERKYQPHYTWAMSIEHCINNKANILNIQVSRIKRMPFNPSKINMLR